MCLLIGWLSPDIRWRGKPNQLVVGLKDLYPGQAVGKPAWINLPHTREHLSCGNIFFALDEDRKNPTKLPFRRNWFSKTKESDYGETFLSGNSSGNPWCEKGWGMNLWWESLECMRAQPRFVVGHESEKEGNNKTHKNSYPLVSACFVPCTVFSAPCDSPQGTF